MPKSINWNAKIVMFKKNILTLWYWLSSSFAFYKVPNWKRKLTKSYTLFTDGCMNGLINPNYRKAVLLKIIIGPNSL